MFHLITRISRKGYLQLLAYLAMLESVYVSPNRRLDVPVGVFRCRTEVLTTRDAIFHERRELAQGCKERVDAFTGLHDQRELLLMGKIVKTRPVVL